ncbi:glycosyltransferase [Pedobacter sp. P351]|uniref:glycosyltransferase n=1 Tax=Pedobacter superstes TaxID=3133441 RepID=UPI0030ADF50F
MRIILIGNYIPDKQESMIRFANLLDEGFKSEGMQSEIWTPKALFGKSFKTTTAGIGKWLGYIDKYVIFPLLLLWRLQRSEFKYPQVRFHICDHSNSPYLKYLPADRSSITCHDVIAIRGGLGYTEFSQPASRFGKILQNWILYHLIKGKSIAFVSELTLKQFKELSNHNQTSNKNWKVIHNSFNASFQPMREGEAKQILSSLNIDVTAPFILHVGSGLPRKNRSLLLGMANCLGSDNKINICFAGEELNKELIDYAGTLGLSKQIISIVKPDHATLVALYSTCSAFVFPSLSEGFGWPVIEAQACGAPVIASNIEPMPEVSGGAALHADPLNPRAFADAYIALRNPDVRKKVVREGFENGLRFDKRLMIQSYFDLFRMNKN